MADRIEIVVTANDAASQILRGIGSQLGSFGNAISAIANGDIVGLTSQVVEFGKESIKTFTEGAQAAKQLSLVSGESIENTSRFIQVLDDYEITQQDALAATKALTKEGLAPNIETLAKLSDQYKAIQDPQEKNEFIIKNLGRAGLQWTKVLDQGSEALLDQADAIDKNLIFTEEMYQQAEDLRLAQDQLNDTWEAAKIQVGTELVPVLQKFLEISNKVDAGVSIWAEDTDVATDATKNNTQAISDNTIELEKSKEQLKAEEDAIKELTKVNQEYLSTLSSLTSEITDFHEKEASLKQEHDELLAKKQSLISQGYWVESDAILDINAKLAENELAQQKNAETFQLETNKRILARAEELVSADGLTTEEKNMLIERGIAMGVYTQEAAARMQEEENAANSLANAINNIPVEKTITINHIDNFIERYGAENLEHLTSPGRAGGGDVSAGMLFRVNETRKEYFRPSMSGTVVPLGGKGGSGGDTYNIMLAPTVMVGDRSRAANELAPIIIDGIRKAKADKII